MPGREEDMVREPLRQGAVGEGGGKRATGAIGWTYSFWTVAKSAKAVKELGRGGGRFCRETFFRGMAGGTKRQRGLRDILITPFRMSRRTCGMGDLDSELDRSVQSKEINAIQSWYVRISHLLIQLENQHKPSKHEPHPASNRRRRKESPKCCHRYIP